MNTLQSMHARRAAHERQRRWKANIKAADPEPDRQYNIAELRDIDRRREKLTAARRVKRQYRQAVTAASATRSREPWTAEDLATALDMSLSSRQAAVRLGRSMYAVNDQRKKAARR